MLELILSPASEPVVYVDVLNHLRMDDFDESVDLASQAYIDRLIAATRRDCEAFTNRAFITQTWKLYLEEWPSENHIDLPKPPLQSVTHVKYTDTAGIQTELSTDYYTVDTKSTKGRIVLKPGRSWPSVTLYSSNPIEIQFVCGYGDLPENVPEGIQLAILLQVGDFWDNREDYREGKLSKTSEKLLWKYRVFS